MTIRQWLLSVFLWVLIGLALMSGFNFIAANLAFFAFLAGLLPIVVLYAYTYLWRRFSPESYRAALFKDILALDKVIAGREKALRDRATSDDDVSDSHRFYE